MILLDWFRAVPLVEAIGWSLLHFVWQGTAIAFVLVVTLAVMRRSSAHARYVACCIGLGLMVAAPVITMVVVGVDGRVPSVAPAAAGLFRGLEDEAVSITTRLAPALPTVTVLWLLGVAMLQGRLLLCWTRGQRLRRVGTQPVAASWLAIMDELRADLGVRTPVQLVESTRAPVPMLIGWLRPVVVVPCTAFTGLTPLQLRAIIAHELSHVLRHDPLVNLLQAVVETLLFYHPAVWWLSDRIRVEREYCCDDLAVRTCGDALAYAQALATLDTLRDRDLADNIHPALASTGGSLMSRIRRIVGLHPLPARRPGAWLAPLAIVAAAAGGLSVLATSSSTSVAAEVHRAGPPPAVIDRVDLHAILEHHDADEIELIDILREAGYDNQTMLDILVDVGAEESILQEIDRAARREVFVEARMNPLRDEIAQRLAAGAIDLDEAIRRLDGASRKLSAVFDQRATDELIELEIRDVAPLATVELRHVDELMLPRQTAEGEVEMRFGPEPLYEDILAPHAMEAEVDLRFAPEPQPMEARALARVKLRPHPVAAPEPAPAPRALHAPRPERVPLPGTHPTAPRAPQAALPPDVSFVPHPGHRPMRLRSLKDRYARALADGSMTEEDVKRELAAMKRRVPKAAPFGPLPRLSSVERDRLRGRLHAAGGKYTEAIAAGELTEAEAAERMERLRRIERALAQLSRRVPPAATASRAAPAPSPPPPPADAPVPISER